MKIREIMRPGGFTIGDTDTLGNAYSIMRRAHIRHLPVMSGDRVVGMLAERDVLTARAESQSGHWWSKTVKTAMKQPLHTAAPDDSLTEVAGRMATSKIGSMPVVERGRLLGIATVTDVLDAEVRAAMEPRPVSRSIAVDAMTPYPWTVDPDAPLADAVAIMVDHHVRHVPVIDSHAELVGMISERDVRTAIGDPTTYVSRQRETPAPARVRDVMSRPAIAITFDTPIAQLAQRFADENRCAACHRQVRSRARHHLVRRRAARDLTLTPLAFEMHVTCDHAGPAVQP